LKARGLLSQIRTIEETPAPPEGGPTAGIDAEDLFVTANFDHDNIFLPYNSHVISLVDRMRVYAGKERHEVTLQGYRELIDIASTYFSVRKYSTANAGMFVQDVRTDKYLVLLLEQLKSLFSQVIKMEDQEGLQQNFYCHIGIAVKVANYKILGRDVANPNLNFVIGYLHRNLLEALRKNVDDAVLNGVRYLQTITAQIPSNHYLTMSQLADHFKEEAVMSIAVQKWYITQETVNGLVEIVVWSLSDSFRTSLTLKSTLKHLSEVARYYVGSGLSVDINGGGLSSAISVVNQNSVPYILNEYLVRTWEKDGTFDENVFEEFCDYYDSLGKIAAESGSFLMHFVLSALNIHIEQLVHLRWHKNQKNSDQFLEGIKKTLRTCRSVYSYLPEDYENRKFGYLEFERIKETALWAAKEKDEGIFTAVVETFVSFYKQARKKTRDEFTALRLYVDLVELGAIASGSGMDEVANKLVNMATEVQKEQMEIHGRGEIPAKYREELEERLSHEIWRLYDDYRQYNPMRHDDIKLESFISREDFMKFLNRIELLVYNREITERRSSMF
jgi:hypothetical protein